MKEKPADKIKIAFVSPNAWTMYNFRREVLESILQSGFEVIIIAEEDKYASLLVSMGCQFVPVSIKNRSLSPADDILLFFWLKKVYKKYRPDFIFHYVIKPNIYGTIAAGILHIPSIAIVTGLGHAFNKNTFLSALIKKLYYFSLRYAYEVWCLNKEDAGFFADNKIVPFKKIRILPGEGVNTDHFRNNSGVPKKKETFTFLMSARLLKSKGIIEYADATLLLRQKGFVFRCLLLGAVEDHPDAISYEQILIWQQEHGLQYQGFTDDVRTCLSEADCFVYPSYYNEGVPRSLMEACSMELPVITTDNTGCRNLIQDGFNGFLCEKHDPFNLAIKMKNMMMLSTNERAIMGKNGRQIVTEKYNINKVVIFYKSLLQTFFAKTSLDSNYIGK